MNYNYIFKQIDKVDIVSFDIFDTLLVRIARTPTDIFLFLEKEFNSFYHTNKNVKNDRINAEKSARFESDLEEISYEQIYDKMYNYSFEEIEWLKNMELELEKKLLFFNPIIKPIYDYCISSNKKIIIESDMYLPFEFISEVLKKNDICYNHIYLSSQINKTKSSGSMFDYMLNDLKISPQNVLHFGDSIKSDFIMARKKSIKSILVYKKRYLRKQINISGFNSLIKDKMEYKLNAYSEIGVNILGPFYLNFSNWLLKKFKEKNINKVFFLSRDGFVMKKAFDIVNDTEIDSTYLYVSRKSLVVPALFYSNSFEEMLDLTNIEVLKEFDYDLFLNKIGLSSDECINELKEMNLSSKTQLFGDKLRKDQTFINFYEIIREKMILNANARLDELLLYLRKNDFYGKIAIVDIGWQGTMQKALSFILNKSGITADIHGYYVGVKKSALSNFEKFNMYGYVFDPLDNVNENKLFSFGGLFEYFYSNSDGSVLYYKNGKPILDVNEYAESKYLDIMKLIQSVGLRYVELSSLIFKYYELPEYNNYSINKLLSFGIKPKLIYIKAFSDLYYSNLKNFYLLPQHSLFYYFFHINEFKRDLNQSFWKVGFLKKLFLLPLPYYGIYNVFKNR